MVTGFNSTVWHFGQRSFTMAKTQLDLVGRFGGWKQRNQSYVFACIRGYKISIDIVIPCENLFSKMQQGYQLQLSPFLLLFIFGLTQGPKRLFFHPINNHTPHTSHFHTNTISSLTHSLPDFQFSSQSSYTPSYMPMNCTHPVKNGQLNFFLTFFHLKYSQLILLSYTPALQERIPLSPTNIITP